MGCMKKRFGEATDEGINSMQRRMAEEEALEGVSYYPFGF
jgi:hypothetical protein